MKKNESVLDIINFYESFPVMVTEALVNIVNLLYNSVAKSSK